MNRRRLVGISLVLALGLVGGNRLEAAGVSVPKQSLSFLVAKPAGVKGSELECTVDFGPALPIAALAFSPDGKRLAVGGYHEVLLWDLEHAKLAQRLGSDQLHGMVHAIAFLQGGQAVAVGDGLPYGRGSVRVFELASETQTRAWEEPTQAAACLAASADGKRLAAGDGAGQAWVWDLGTGKLLKSLDAHPGGVRGLGFSPDGKHLVTGGADRTMQLWDTNTWEPIVRYDLPAPVHGVTFNPKGEIILGALGGEGQWGLATARLETALQESSKRKPSARLSSTGTGVPLDVVWPNGTRYAYVACSNHTIQGYQDGSGKLAQTLTGHTDWVYVIACTADGTRLASGSADGTVKLWNSIDGALVATLVQLTPNTDQWLLMTPSGYFTSSASQSLHWKNDKKPVATADLNRRFESVEEVRKLLTASATAAPPPRSSPERPGKKKKGQRR